MKDFRKITWMSLCLCMLSFPAFGGNGVGILNTDKLNGGREPGDLVYERASIVSLYYSGEPDLYSVDWEHEIVDFETTSATFEEVFEEAREIENGDLD